jgi:subtilisin family serine protease
VTADAYITQIDAPWGLGRVSSRAPGGNSYTYDEGAGAGTCAYVIDSGINTAHQDFGGRATWLATFVDDRNVENDNNGHGTHVAGIIGGATYGVAKKTNLYAVKVLNFRGSGNTSTIIAGMDFVATDSQTRHCPNGTVANASLRSSPSEAMNAAAAAVVKAGVFFTVSAGNANRDASSQSPAQEPTVCTVGATQSDDAKADYSNYGPLVDIFAPGTDILSAWAFEPDRTVSQNYHTNI